jgi:5-methylcytosine-specific restriction endonuclease McrA
MRRPPGSSPRYEYNRARRAANPELYRAQSREWCKKNLRRDYKRRWSRSHPESVRATNVKQYWNNRESRLKSGKAYREAHAEEVAKKMAAYHRKTYSSNRAILLAKTKAYAQAHPEVRRKCYLNYKARHPDRYRAYIRAQNTRRRAVVRGAEVKDGGRVNRLIQKWRQAKQFTCYYCGNSFGIRSLEVEHIVPISRGGMHTVENICKSCPKCNSSKHTKPISKVIVNGQPLLCL